MPAAVKRLTSSDSGASSSGSGLGLGLSVMATLHSDRIKNMESVTRRCAEVRGGFNWNQVRKGLRSGEMVSKVSNVTEYAQVVPRHILSGIAGANMSPFVSSRHVPICHPVHITPLTLNHLQ